MGDLRAKALLRRSIENGTRPPLLSEEMEVRVDPLREAVEERVKVLGRRHRLVADAFDELAGLVKDSGDDKTALELWRRALAIREEILWPDHPRVLAGKEQLALLLEVDDRPQEARPLLAAIVAAQSGYTNRSCSLRLHTISQYLRVLDTLADLDGMKALLAQQTAIDPNTPELTDILRQIAHTARRRGDLATARGALDRIVRMPMQPELPKTLRLLDLYGLSRVTAAMGDDSAWIRTLDAQLAVDPVDIRGLHERALWHLARGEAARTAPLLLRLQSVQKKWRDDWNALQSRSPAKGELRFPPDFGQIDPRVASLEAALHAADGPAVARRVLAGLRVDELARKPDDPPDEPSSPGAADPEELAPGGGRQLRLTASRLRELLGASTDPKSEVGFEARHRCLELWLGECRRKNLAVVPWEKRFAPLSRQFQINRMRAAKTLDAIVAEMRDAGMARAVYPREFPAR